MTPNNGQRKSEAAEAQRQRDQRAHSKVAAVKKVGRSLNEAK